MRSPRTMVSVCMALLMQSTGKMDNQYMMPPRPGGRGEEDRGRSAYVNGTGIRDGRVPPLCKDGVPSKTKTVVASLKACQNVYCWLYLNASIE